MTKATGRNVTPGAETPYGVSAKTLHFTGPFVSTLSCVQSRQLLVAAEPQAPSEGSALLTHTVPPGASTVWGPTSCTRTRTRPSR